MSEPVYIVDIIRDAVARTSTRLLARLQAIDATITRIGFEYGHINDIRERLATADKSGINISPLVALIEDYRLRKGTLGMTGVTDLKLIILHRSKADITRQQREDNVFRPVLYPIYNEVLNQLLKSGVFMETDVSQLRHDQINRPHWGDPALYGNTQYPLTYVFDGIEIANLQLTAYLNNCL